MALKQLHYDSDPREITGRRVKAIQNSCPLHLYYSQQLVPLQLHFTGSMLDGQLVASKYLISEAKQNQLSTPSPLPNCLQIQTYQKC